MDHNPGTKKRITIEDSGHSEKKLNFIQDDCNLEIISLRQFWGSIIVQETKRDKTHGSYYTLLICWEYVAVAINCHTFNLLILQRKKSRAVKEFIRVNQIQFKFLAENLMQLIERMDTHLWDVNEPSLMVHVTSNFIYIEAD